jgi:hypothetical protein
LVSHASVPLAIMMIIKRKFVTIACFDAKHALMDNSVLLVRGTESTHQNVSVLRELMRMVFRKHVILALSTANLV